MSKPKQEYRVVEQYLRDDQSIDEFNNLISAALNTGWELVGGPVLKPEGERDSYASIMQAMVKYYPQPIARVTVNPAR